LSVIRYSLPSRAIDSCMEIPGGDGCEADIILAATFLTPLLPQKI